MIRKYISFFLCFLFLFAGSSAYAQEENPLSAMQRAQEQVVEQVLEYTVSIKAQQLLDAKKRPVPSNKEGGGSGFIVSRDGYVITNKHVIDPVGLYSTSEPIEEQPQYYTYTITPQGNSELSAHVVAISDIADIAVLQMEHVPKDIAVAPFGDPKKLQSGQIVYAVGSPFGFEESVSTGIISNSRREREQLSKQHSLIQTDATINPGNSGGPLANIYGEVIGVNVMIFSKTGQSAGIGFAIPIDIAEGFFKKVSEGKNTQSGWVGVSVQVLDDEMRSYVGGSLPVNSSDLYVTNVDEKGPAGGLIQEGDIIIAVDEEILGGKEQFKQYVANRGVGKEVVITLFRRGETKEVKVETRALP